MLNVIYSQVVLSASRPPEENTAYQGAVLQALPQRLRGPNEFELRKQTLDCQMSLMLPKIVKIPCPE